MAFTQSFIETLALAGVYTDEDGLSITVHLTGTKSWTLRVESNGVLHDFGLGSFPEVSLNDAREKTRGIFALINSGIEPLGHITAYYTDITLKNETLDFIEKHQSGWSAKHTSQWLNSMREHVFPVIGAIAVSSAETSDVLKVLDPIWQEKPETARRIRNRLERVFDFAKMQGHRHRDNPARWKGHLQHLMPDNRNCVAPLESMDFLRLPFFMQILDEDDSRAARCLQYLILTACRTSEAIGARWDEIDMINRVWTIPAERMKNGVEHQIPLSEEAIQVLKDAGSRGRSEIVFPGVRSTTAMSDNALRRLLRKMGEDCTPHGFRTTFRTWTAEKTAFSNELCELSLAHAIGNAVSRNFLRGNLLEKRRPLMSRWSKYAMGRVTSSSTVSAKQCITDGGLPR